MHGVIGHESSLGPGMSALSRSMVEEVKGHLFCAAS